MSRDKIGIEIDLEADRMVNALLGETYFRTRKKSYSGGASAKNRG